MDIKESNKLIAEFMEIELFNHSLFGLMSNEEEHVGEEGQPMPLSYHFSWDWLMPVVETIQSLNETNESFGALIDISTTHIKISTSIGSKNFNYVDSKPQKDWKPFDIKRVYKAVVEFIKWYNNQKENE